MEKKPNIKQQLTSDKRSYDCRAETWEDPNEIFGLISKWTNLLT